jgi:uncharacterized protein
MPIINSTDHRAPFWLPNGHFQSIYPALFRKVSCGGYERERIFTDDGDFIDLDWAFSGGKKKRTSASLVILSHGLEGSSSSQYIKGMVKVLVARGFDCLSWNFRSCSGELNKTSRFYHSGATDDMHRVVLHCVAYGYSHIQMMGFSLGGNLTLKYLGEQGGEIRPEVTRGVVFSVPMDLKASSVEINRFQNQLYMRRFLKTLMRKVREKSVYFPEAINMKYYGMVHNLYDFDHIYTATIHGFNGADDYYHRCSSMHFVERIAVPTLIINAVNDPMVPHQSLPSQKIDKLEKVWIEITQQGGHCGYRPAHIESDGLYWSEGRALAFLEHAQSI